MTIPALPAARSARIRCSRMDDLPVPDLPMIAAPIVQSTYRRRTLSEVVVSVPIATSAGLSKSGWGATADASFVGDTFADSTAFLLSCASADSRSPSDWHHGVRRCAGIRERAGRGRRARLHCPQATTSMTHIPRIRPPVRRWLSCSLFRGRTDQAGAGAAGGQRAGGVSGRGPGGVPRRRG
jgi:hypothetical protein